MTEFCDNCAVRAAETGEDWSLERPAEDGHQVRTLRWEASSTRAPGAHTWPTAGMQVTTVASRVRLALWTHPSSRTLLDPGFAGPRSILPLQGGQVGSCSALLFSQGQRMMASPSFPPCMTGKPAPTSALEHPYPHSASARSLWNGGQKCVSIGLSVRIMQAPVSPLQYANAQEMLVNVSPVGRQQWKLSEGNSIFVFTPWRWTDGGTMAQEVEEGRTFLSQIHLTSWFISDGASTMHACWRDTGL